MTRTRGLLSHLLHSCTQSHWAKVVAGMGAGVAVAFILTPVELVKCRLQVDRSQSLLCGPNLTENYLIIQVV